jgi:hypothetical protein
VNSAAPFAPAARADKAHEAAPQLPVFRIPRAILGPDRHGASVVGQERGKPRLRRSRGASFKNSCSLFGRRSGGGIEARKCEDGSSEVMQQDRSCTQSAAKTCRS